MSKAKKLTPMLEQYFNIKKQYPDCIVLFRMGDFYEIFGQDAVEASRILQITLTSRHKGTENEIPMCGVPHHSVGQYIPKLTKAGKKIAVCEQVSDPKLPGLVEREVMRVITPGTSFEENVLDSKENNFLVGIYGESPFGFGFIDITTGEFRVCEIENKNKLLSELYKINPKEIIVSEKFLNNIDFIEELRNLSVVNKFELTEFQDAYEILCSHFKTKNLKGFGLEGKHNAVICAGHLLSYLQETQKTKLEHINSIGILNLSEFMVLDEITLRNLDVLYNSFDNGFENSLLWVLDKTITPMGGRLLRNWLVYPLKNKSKIQERLDIVEFFVQNKQIAKSFILLLKKISDLYRLVGKLGCNRVNPRDLVNLKTSLETIPEIKTIFQEIEFSILREKVLQLEECSDLIDLLDNSLKQDPPITITEGGIFKQGFNKELDDLREIAFSGKDFIRNLQAKEIEKTGITSLKIKFNKVFGYYIEISKSYLDKVPDYYIRKQTLVNAERFIIPELKEYEEKVLGAEEKICELEHKLFLDLIEKVKPFYQQIQKNAEILAELDVLVSFAQIAEKNNYCKPNLNNENRIEIKQGRHPVIEQSHLVEDYIPNDILLDDKNYFLLLTGPNMAGKSSFLRQTALIVLLAHIGSFVPAEFADICIVDRIFTRVGASDNLSRGQSTFMVEMQEAANILHNATKQSLIILDEIGRGTSTYDGLSIAWAIIEYIYQRIKAKTLFATHYHELIKVIDDFEFGKNYSMAVHEDDKKVVFLHKVVQGGCDKSYGIEVAKLAGIPLEVVQSANEFLNILENQKQGKTLQPSLFEFQNKNCKKSPADNIFAKDKQVFNKIKTELQNIDINTTTPLEALEKLQDLKNLLKDLD